MQFSMITDPIRFIGRQKHQRKVFWNLAPDQTRFLYNVATKQHWAGFYLVLSSAFSKMLGHQFQIYR